jgi:hypothetical protein
MAPRFTCDFSFALNIIEGVMVCQIFGMMFYGLRSRQSRWTHILQSGVWCERGKRVCSFLFMAVGYPWVGC